MTSGKRGDLELRRWLFGKLGHGGEGNEAVPRLIEALNRVAVKQVAAGCFIRWC